MRSGFHELRWAAGPCGQTARPSAPPRWLALPEAALRLIREAEPIPDLIAGAGIAAMAAAGAYLISDQFPDCLLAQK
jgi:hypothetical protein